MARRKKKEYELFKVYYCEKGYTQKDAAEKAGVTEKTASKWVNENEGELEKLRKSLLTTKTSQLSRLYDQLERLNNDIATRPEVRESDTKPIKLDAKGNPKEKAPVYDPIVLSNVPTTKEADIISKITKAIQQLENETSLGDTIQVGRDFISFVRGMDLALAKKVTHQFDLFIKEKIR